MTVNQLALAIGVASGSPTAWKRGTKPNYATIKKIAEYLNVPADHFFSEGNDRQTTFYERFLELCSQKNVSRTQACVECGLCRTGWHKWENGGEPNGKALKALAQYFGVSVDELLGVAEENEPSQKLPSNEVLFRKADEVFLGEYMNLTESDKKAVRWIVHVMCEAREYINQDLEDVSEELQWESQEV